MALSASFDFTVARSDIIPMAMRKLGVLGEGQTPTTNQTTTASLALNVMLKAFMADGLPLWYMKTGYIYPIHNVNVYYLASSGGGHFSQELVITKLTAAAAASATALTVSITAANDVQGTTANSDQIGIELDDGTIHWTTLSAGGGTTGLTIATGLASAAASGNRVYAYTAKANRPAGIQAVWRVDAANQTRIKLDPTPYVNLMSQSNLTTEGQVTTWSYLETITAVPGTSTGTFTIWPRWVDGSSYLEVWFQQEFDDMDADANNLAFPAEWYEAIIYGLALRLADEYQVPDNVYKRVQGAAMAARERAESATTEGTSIYVYPEFR